MNTNTTNSTAQLQSQQVIYGLYAQYGKDLRCLTYEQKIVMRAALAGFIAERPVWIDHENGISCIDCCIESAGVDWNIWVEDQDLCQWITDCSRLDEESIEELIAVLSGQIRSKVYKSRSV